MGKKTTTIASGYLFIIEEAFNRRLPILSLLLNVHRAVYARLAYILGAGPLCAKMNDSCARVRESHHLPQQIKRPVKPAPGGNPGRCQQPEPDLTVTLLEPR